MRFLKILSFVSVLGVSTSFEMDLTPGGREPKIYSFYSVMMSIRFYNEIFDMLQQSENIVTKEQNQTIDQKKRSKNFEKDKRPTKKQKCCLNFNKATL